LVVFKHQVIHDIFFEDPKMNWLYNLLFFVLMTVHASIDFGENMLKAFRSLKQSQAVKTKANEISGKTFSCHL